MMMFTATVEFAGRNDDQCGFVGRLRLCHESFPAPRYRRVETESRAMRTLKVQRRRERDGARVGARAHACNRFFCLARSMASC